jgi:hypothetical protein
MTVLEIRSVQTEFIFVDCEVLLRNTMKNSEILDVTPCKSWKMHAMKQTANRAVFATLIHADFLLSLPFGLEDGGDIFFRNVG